MPRIGYPNGTGSGGVPAAQGDVANLASAAAILDALTVWRYDAAPGSLTAGRFNAGLVNAKGAVLASSPASGGNGDSLSPDPVLWQDLAGTNRPLATVPFGYNDNATVYERQRPNMSGTLLASAARTGSTTSPTQTSYSGRGVLIFLDVTAASGTGGLTVKLRALDPVTGGGFHINVDPTAITATGSYGYMIYPGASSAGGGTATVKQFTPAAVPRTWNVSVVHGDASSYTYSLGYALIN